MPAPEVVEDGSIPFCCLQHRTLKAVIKMENITILTTLISTLNARGLSCFVTSIGLGGSCSSGIPPQTFLFPTIDISLTLLKTPPVGTLPNKLFRERFGYRMLFIEGKRREWFPQKHFLADLGTRGAYNHQWFLEFLPDNLVLEISNAFIWCA
ncbi:unnamed protein product [Ilex paraguariensis]